MEVEAYIGEEDRASHARFGRTARNGVMYGPPGIAYVYLVYGMHECLNVVTEPEGRPAAVLIRAVEPLDESAEAAMRASRLETWRRRQRRTSAPDVMGERERLARVPAARLASGPGLVAAAFGVTRDDTGADLLEPGTSLRIEAGTAPRRIEATPRVGVGYASEPWQSRPWRLLDADSPAVSGARPRGSAS